MSIDEKIGVGIITCGRRELFSKCISSVANCEIDSLTVVEDIPDGVDLSTDDYIKKYRYSFEEASKCKNSQINEFADFIINGHNLGVAKSKNLALKSLLDKGCDHIFLIEDDIYIKKTDVFEKYIKASKASGIQHFNFSQHGLMNKFWVDKSPKFQQIISYGEENIAFYQHCVGAFSYYTKHCLDKVGLMDQNYYNACEHVDHTYMIIKAGMHPPFWNFADIDRSWEYLGDEEWSLEKSTISSKSNHKEIMKKSDDVFYKKHNHYPMQIKQVDIGEFYKSIKDIKSTYGK